MFFVLILFELISMFCIKFWKRFWKKDSVLLYSKRLFYFIEGKWRLKIDRKLKISLNLFTIQVNFVVIISVTLLQDLIQSKTPNPPLFYMYIAIEYLKYIYYMIQCFLAIWLALIFYSKSPNVDRDMIGYSVVQWNFPFLNAFG